MTAHATATVEPGRGAWQPWPRVGVRMPRPLHTALAAEAKARGMHPAAIVRELVAQALGLEAHPRPDRQPGTTDNTDSNRTLSPRTAALLKAHHLSSGRTYRASAELAGVDQGYFWRLCAGQRAPSKATAEKLIRRLGLPAPLAEALREEAVESVWRQDGGGVV